MPIEKAKVTIRILHSFSIIHQGFVDFDRALSLFDWTLENKIVVFDFSHCRTFDSKAFALLILYIWFLRERNCDVEMIGDEKIFPVLPNIWREITAERYFDVLQSVNDTKFFLTIKDVKDDRDALEKAEKYARLFNIEYEKTTRYIISELLYNTREHGKNQSNIPSLFQITWEKNKSELSILIADLGIGIKQHLRQTYSQLSNDVEALTLAIKPLVSGTFGISDNPYQSKNNAGVGLYLSTNIANRLLADTFIVSGNGQIHISANGITTKKLEKPWNGTFVVFKVKLGAVENINLGKFLAEFRKSMTETTLPGQKDSLYLNIRNHFGRYAEDKELAIKLRDEKLLAAIADNKIITIDFEEIISAPHSFLNALLATMISRLGMSAYKKIKIINASPEIRETVDFILDENTKE